MSIFKKRSNYKSKASWKRLAYKRGQKVIIENTRSNIQILVDGIALKSAMKDEYTDVLNKSTGKIVKAWVKNNKKVSVFR